MIPIEFSTLAEELKQFSTMGKRSHYLFGINISEGVKYLSDETGCYWLLDEITLNQHNNRLYNRPYQLWNLTLDRFNRRKAWLICFDRKNRPVFDKTVEREVFPLESIELIMLSNTIMLSTEYH